MTVDTAFTAVLIGYVKSNGRQTTHLAADVANDFCMLLLSSLDARPLDQSSRMLLATTADARTRPQLAGGARYAGAVGHGTDGHRAGVWHCPPPGTGPSRAIDVTPLSPTGKRLADQPAVDHEGGTWTLGLKEPSATWYLVELERPDDHWITSPWSLARGRLRVGLR